MDVGILLHLPDEAERFDPVCRLLPGARLLIGSGRWAPARRDSRAATRVWLRRRGWVAVEDPEPVHDLILTTDSASPASAARWLAPGGRIVLWHEPRARPRFLHALPTPGAGSVLDPLVDRVCAAFEPEGIDRERVAVTGDPALDVLADPAAASRARHALGLDGSRPVVAVALDTPWCRPDWARALAALRADVDLVLRPTTPCWLEAAGSWPRALTGPGLRIVDPLGPCTTGELLALADAVLAPVGRMAHLARAAGRRLLLMADGQAGLRTEAARVQVAGRSLDDGPTCTHPDALPEAVVELLRMSAPKGSGDGMSASRLAAVIGELLRLRSLSTV